MRHFCFGALLLFVAAARAEDAADKPTLVLQSGGHTAPVWKVLFTPDGKEVVTVSVDKTVRLWDAATGERLGVLRAPFGPDVQGNLNTGALYGSPDGKIKTLAVGGRGYDRDGKPFHPVYLIDLVAGRAAAALEQSNDVTALAFSHDGARLATADVGGGCAVWDVASGKRLIRWRGHPTQVCGLAFSPDDKLLASASFDKTARLWSATTGKEAAGPMEHENRVSCVAWKDNDTLATGGEGQVFIHLWDRTGKPLRHFDTLRPKPAAIYSLVFRPGDELFYTWVGHDMSGCAFLNVTTPEASRDGPTYNNNGSRCGDVSPDGKLAASTTGSGENAVSLWTVQDGKQVLQLSGQGQVPFRAGWASKGRVVGWANARKAGAGKDELQRSFDLDGLRFGARPDSKYIRAVPDLGDLHLGRLGNPITEVRRKTDLIATLKTPGGALSAAWLPGDRVALGYYSSIYVYNARTGELLRTLKGFTSAANELAVSADGRYLLGACADQTLRVWDVEKEEPLLSLFVAGADWVAWTEEGYYAASPAGEKLMGWQVNNGLEQLGTFHPAAEFHKAFYRPDVIRRVLVEGSVAKALAAADKESGATTQAVDVARALPPEVRIVSPAQGKLEKAETEVKAAALGKDRPVISLRLLLDGRPFPGAEVKTFPDARPGEKQEATWAVTLPEGEHTLNARAESDVSAAASADVAVSYQAAQEALPTLYVVAVGINAYPGGLKLDWAVDDATAVAKAFRAEGAPRPFGKVEAKLLLDKDATKEGILAALDSLKTMTSDDTAVVFYAGHGHRDRKSGQFFMLPVDVDPGDLEKTGVTGTAIKEKLKAAPGRVLVLLDACHSGSIGQSPADPGSLTDDVQRQLAAPDCGVVVMCAAMAQEEAGEAAAVKHGFFTAALLSGLGGSAPHDRKDGLIHLTALDYFVEEEVAELSKDEQHVVVDRPSTVTSFPLVKPPAKADEK